MSLRVLERLTTRHLVLSTSIFIAVVLTCVVSVLVLAPSGLDKMGKVVDVVLKSTAAIIGGAWALNRYFTTRTDELQLRVDSDVQAISAGSFKETADLGMLIARLDIVNTGKALLPEFEQRIIVNDVRPTTEGIKSDTLYTWPEKGLHPGGPIEPGSWSAINFAHTIPASTLAVQVYLEIYMNDSLNWTWHKTFRLEVQAAGEAR